MPRGPRKNLRPVALMKSAPISPAATGSCPIDWQASTKYQAEESAARRAAPMATTSLIRPFCDGQWLMTTAATSSPNRFAKAVTSTHPCSSSGMNSRRTPRDLTSCMIGSTLEAYSDEDTKMRSPELNGREWWMAVNAFCQAAVADSSRAI